jgi:diguanylate cyclase (GGDEF)-like protein
MSKAAAAALVRNDVCAELRRENRRLRAELAALEQLREAAYRDPLTGLRNRRYFDERLAEELARLARSDERGGSLLVVDLDGFKAINDRHGHAAGDVVLCEVATVLEATLRLEDLCCRTGGDEFMIVLPDAATDGARRAAGRVRDALARRNLAAALSVSASVGAASWPDDGRDAATLVGVADAAMYADKQRAHPPRRSTRPRLRLV